MTRTERDTINTIVMVDHLKRVLESFDPYKNQGPLKLTPFLLTTVQRLIDVHLKEEVLLQRQVQVFKAFMTNSWACSYKCEQR